jgi:hypothetical protein
LKLISGGKKMAVENGNKSTAKQLYTVSVCPNCGKTVHKSRMYCDCHANLNQAKVRITEEPPEIDRCNFETAGLTCADCPETCDWCASYGVDHANSEGFGGIGCRHRKNDARCHCCQAQAEISTKLGQFNLGELLRKATNVKHFYEVGDVIAAEMKAPILARINQAVEKAG